MIASGDGSLRVVAQSGRFVLGLMIPEILRRVTPGWVTLIVGVVLIVTGWNVPISTAHPYGRGG